MKKALVSLALLMLSLPAAFADPVIYRGIDVWVTPADGKTFTDFAAQPIPAGFFCAGSKAFTGRVPLRGIPIVTGKTGELGRADTIVERLDDATFNAKGVAATRLRFRGLSLESIAPIQTECGSFDVRVSLAGLQPITRMQIFKETEEGGRFLAPLALNVKLTFTPTRGRVGQPLELTQQVRFAPDPRASWSFGREGLDPLSRPAPIQIDTDGDRMPDRLIPGVTNFLAGRKEGDGLDKGRTICHEGGTKGEHCVIYTCEVACW